MDFEATKRNLEKRGFCVTAFPTAVQAAEYLNGSIDGTSVGIGGSVTVKEMNLFEMLKKHNEVWWHNDAEQVEKYGADAVRAHAAHTDVYISSVNGLSEQGQLINIDNTGNRLAATCYGHKKLYLVIGNNKIAENFEKAMWRARNIASPKNAMRLGIKTPCAVKGDRCYDCTSPNRICRGFLIMEAPLKGQETEIVLVDEPLGF